MRTIEELEKLIEQELNEFRELYGIPSKFENYDPFEHVYSKQAGYLTGFKSDTLWG
jgi:hypothetical protein